MTIQQAFELAVREHQAGRLGEAESLYRQILAVEPRHAESIHHLGIIAHQVGRNDAAVNLIRQVTALAPGYAEAYNNLGVVLEALGQNDEAIAAYRQAISLKPDYPDAQNNLQSFLRKLGRLDEAVTACMPKDPTNDIKPAAEPSFLSVHDAAPQELKKLSPMELAKFWPEWVERQNRQVRSRVWRGEEDSLANFLLLGTSYTREPRVTNAYRDALVRELGSEADADRKLDGVVGARSLDLALALAKPGDDERLIIMREVVNRAGHGPRTVGDQSRLVQYLCENMVRFLNESRAYADESARAKRTSSGTASSAHPNLYQARGLSTDSSVLVDFALQQGLHDAAAGSFLERGSVLRAGVVGAGLDLIDKLWGYDLHPPQVTQPLVLMDTLLKLELAKEHDLRVTTFDVSNRVNQHIERAVNSAANGKHYELNLIHDNSWDWSPEAIRFWQTCGDRIGTAAISQPVFELNGISNKSIQVHPKWMTRVHSIDLDFIYQELLVPEDQRFDLLVATNVLCYYTPFEQSLALRHAGDILRPGGVLLTTERLPEIGCTDMHLAGSTLVQTSAHGYEILCYRRSSS